MTTLADQVRTGFQQRFGRPPEGLWFAPGRVNLIGEHVDYAGGLCLPIALEQATIAAVARRGDDRIVVASLDKPRTIAIELADVAPGKPSNWAAYVAGVFWALRKAGHEVTGVYVLVGSDVPIGAGLSSSAALEGSVAAAASDLFGLGLLASDDGRRELARHCQTAENDIALAPTGGLDQTASLRASAGYALEIDCLDFSVVHAPFDPAAHRLALIVVDTRAKHSLVDGQYGARRAAVEKAAETLGVATLRDVKPESLADALAQLPDELVPRARHVVTEIDRVRDAVTALSEGDMGRFGDLWYASHESLRSDFEVSCEELDAVVEVARAHQALGARMTGGGFGGSAIALVPLERVDGFVQAVTSRFAEEGWDAPRTFPAAAGPAAGRLGK